MKLISPGTIAVSAMGLALVWSLLSAPVGGGLAPELHGAASGGGQPALTVQN